MQQAHVVISGFVQGVGFRAFVQKAARESGVTGWVKNIPDNRVEAVLQGKIDDVKKLILLCRKGPFLAEVEDVVVSWENASRAYQDFTVV